LIEVKGNEVFCAAEASARVTAVDGVHHADDITTNLAADIG
jgi:hypothetical protein